MKNDLSKTENTLLPNPCCPEILGVAHGRGLHGGTCHLSKVPE
jgi:hypothetical protein